MGVAFVAAQDTSSSFFVFAWSDGFQSSEDLSVKISDAALNFGFVAQKPVRDSDFEQTRGDVSIGLIIEFSSPVEAFDFWFDRSQRGGEEVEKSQGGKDVGMAQIGQMRREIGELEERFEDKKTGFDAPSQGINSSKMGVWKLFWVGQGGQKHFSFARRQVNTNEPKSEIWMRIFDCNFQVSQGFACPLTERFGDNLFAFAGGDEGSNGAALSNWHAHNTLRIK